MCLLCVLITRETLFGLSAGCPLRLNSSISNAAPYSLRIPRSRRNQMVATLLYGSQTLATVSGRRTALASSRCQFAGTRALAALAPPRRARGRSALQVEANELNKWAGRAMDDDAGYEENPFDRDTATVLLRVLTARSVKKLLLQLQELDLHQAAWFNNYCAEHPPTEGNKFLLELFAQSGTVVVDHLNNTSHNIDPQNLAHRLLQIRDDMARRATSALPQYVELENTTVLRTHLERSTFVSGSTTEASGSSKRRGYFNQRRSNGAP